MKNLLWQISRQRISILDYTLEREYDQSARRGNGKKQTCTLTYSVCMLRLSIQAEKIIFIYKKEKLK